MSAQREREEGEPEEQPTTGVEEKNVVTRQFGNCTVHILNGVLVKMEGLEDKICFFLDKIPYLRQRNKKIYLGQEALVTFDEQTADEFYEFIVDAMVASKNK